MSVVITENYTVGGVEHTEANSPHILYDSHVRDATVTADEEESGQPVSLLQHYLTAPGERWAGTSTSEQNVDFDFGSPVAFDALGIAAHNLGTIGGSITFQESSDGVTYNDIATYVPADDETILILFGTVTKRYARLVITPGSAAPEIGVVYIGEVMPVQHTLYGGHKPTTLGRSANRIGQVSDSGHFLGLVIMSESETTSANLTHLKAGWYRSTFKDFERAAATKPFFWAWRPDSYPKEVGFAWLTSLPKPENTGPGDLMSVKLDMRVFVG